MTMKALLVPIEPHGLAQPILETTFLFATRFDSHIEGISVRPNYAGFIAVDPIGVAAFPEIDEQIAEQAKKSRQSFEDFLRAKVPALSNTGPGAGISYGWAAHQPVTEGAAAGYARIFDLSVLGRPSGENHGPTMSLFEAMLFESGRPILVAPPKPPKQIGDTVVIAWNQSTETARATALAMPVLERARQVVVLTVTGGTVPGPTGAEMAGQLKRNGIPARDVTVAPGRRSNGETILAEATALGCDLLVKGAYTQSRLRQMIFGGATSHILAATQLPVFMAG